MPITANPRQIEVLIAVNANSLSENVKGGATPSTATFLTTQQANEYIVMMAPRPFMTNANPDSNLQLKAVTDDVIRWRGVSFAPLRNGALLVAFNYVSGQNIISRPNLVPVQKYTKVQRAEGQPENFSSELYTDSRWEATCKTAGSADYHFTIATTEPGSEGDTRVLGYYRWDPRIVVTFS